MRLALVTAVLIALSVAAHFLWGSGVQFVLSCAAIIPLAGILGQATEEVAKRQGPAVGGLLNATFGNATELILALVALREGGALVEMVKASITGSIIGNLLLVLGLSIVAGGLRYKTMTINPAASGMAASQMVLAVIGLVVPAMFAVVKPGAANAAIDHMSVAVAAVLLAMYALGLVYSLGTHRHAFTGPDEMEEAPEPPLWSMTTAVTVLLVSTLLVVLESELLIHAIEPLIETLHLSVVFMGAVVVAVIGNAAEHAVAVLMARKGQMNLAFQVACGSSTQVALFVAPVLVFASIAMGRPMNLLFTTFEVMAIVLSVGIVRVITSDGETNWFEGSQLLAVYAILCVAFYEI